MNLPRRALPRGGALLITVVLVVLVAGAALAAVLSPRAEIRRVAVVSADLPGIGRIVVDDEGRDRLVASMPPGAEADAVAAVPMRDELLVVTGFDACGLDNPRLVWRGRDHLDEEFDGTGVNCAVPVHASAVFAVERADLPDRVTLGGREADPTDPVIEARGARVEIPRIFPTARLVRVEDPGAPPVELLVAVTPTDVGRLLADSGFRPEHVVTGPDDVLLVVRHRACPFINRLVLDDDADRLFLDTDELDTDDGEGCTDQTVEVAAFVAPRSDLPARVTFGVGPDAGGQDVVVDLR